MLMDVLAAVIAFASAMLLFSLVVTASVQAIHAIAQLRYHNLRVGMALFLEELANDPIMDDESVMKKIKETATRLVSVRKANVIIPIPVKPESIDITDLQDSVRQTFGSSFGKEQLSTLESCLMGHFRRTELFMVQRFQRISNGLAIFIGLLIAVIFQINTPELLKKLSTDPALRDAYIRYVEEQINSEKENHYAVAYSVASEKSIKQLINMHPKLKAPLETFSAANVNNTHDALQQLQHVLAQNPGAFNQLKGEYQDNIERELLTQTNRRITQWQKQSVEMALLNFTIMPNGMGYYTNIKQGYDLIENYIGVFISGILISLGAPFWFNNLKVLFSLRARLKHHTT